MMQQTHNPREWPETDNYLERVGQINNDLMLDRETLAREAIIPTWLDKLAISQKDLTQKPDVILVVKHLHSYGVTVPSLLKMDVYREMAAEHERYHLANEEEMTSLMEDHDFTTLGPTEDAELYASPELESALKKWARNSLELSDIHDQEPTKEQALMLINLSMFLHQEQGMTPEWAADSKRSLLSSSFYERTGNQTPQNE